MESARSFITAFGAIGSGENKSIRRLLVRGFGVIGSSVTGFTVVTARIFSGGSSPSDCASQSKDWDFGE
jgi:hypothetical protein